MASIKSLCCIRLLLLLVLTSHVIVNGDEQKNFYIVYMGERPSSILGSSMIESHANVLSTEMESSLVASHIVRSYTKSFSAFAAKLTPNEAEQLSSKDGVISVFPNRYHQLATRHSWDFIGFPQTVKRNLKLEGDIVVGLLDSGITPESESFNDEGFGPPPAKWKGTCGPYANFTGCNNKLIGARYYKLDGEADPLDILSPTDVKGHGTHTASTIAGNLVEGANLYGLAQGTARGAVPSARIAMYKVCWVSNGCSDMDILAAFDASIADGVDVISVSLGGNMARSYFSDAIAIGSFHAMQKGIITTAAAGNDGPVSASVANFAPWMLTVAASATDRQFRSKVVLGNGKEFEGIGVNTYVPRGRFYPLISGADAGINATASDSRYCIEDTLDPAKVKGKIVFCDFLYPYSSLAVKKAGGIGIIQQTDPYPDAESIFLIPGSIVNKTIGQTITDYINSTRSPSAVIFKSQEFNTSAPHVPLFSSRGPNPASKFILKPDITAPGVSILAAYTPLQTVSELEEDTRHTKYTLMSGTSMACPHVGGVAAYIKSFYPKWSPAAIKSAIMTTARPMSSKVNEEAEFAYGAGLVNPVQALNPGLVYDMDQLTYMQFLCNAGYSGTSLGNIAGLSYVNCSSLAPGQGTDALNYPSMLLTMSANQNITVAVYRRRVTNVGPAQSIYIPVISAPTGVEITVRPSALSFSRAYQKRSFALVVKAKRVPATVMRSGSLVWRSSGYNVRSPIVIYDPQGLVV